MIVKNGVICFCKTLVSNDSSIPANMLKELCLECTPSGSGGAKFMVARALITPRTIASGEIVTFSYTINPCGGA